MSQKKSIAVAVTAVVIAIAAGIIYFTDEKTIISDEKEVDVRKEWIVSGPFAINKASYLIGDNLFMTVNGLVPNEKGNIIFIRPDGSVYNTIPFDGSRKSNFNQYFTPSLSRPLKVCDVDDLVGTWQVIFQGVPYEPITFEIVNEFLMGEEKKYEPMC